MSDTDLSQLPRIELEGAAEAPVIVFDEAPLFGVMPGMGRITLSVLVQDEDGQGGSPFRRVAVAHLRGNQIALEALRQAINQMEAMLQPPLDQRPN